MISAPRTPRTLATRFVALVLLCAFVLQTAARASDGCLARVVSGACCCASADEPSGGADAALETETSSCCAAKLAHGSTAPDAPAVGAARACRCAAGALPIAPVAPNPVSADERAFERALHAPAVAPVDCTVVRSALERDACAHPPDPRRAPERAPRVDRGACERLSRLCVWLV